MGESQKTEVRVSFDELGRTKMIEATTGDVRTVFGPPPIPLYGTDPFCPPWSINLTLEDGRLTDHTIELPPVPEGDGSQGEST